MPAIRLAWVAVLAFLGAASAARAEPAKTDCGAVRMSARLCLTLAVQSAAQLMEMPHSRTDAFIKIADMQMADGRADLASRSLSLARDAALTIRSADAANIMERIGARRAAVWTALGERADWRVEVAVVSNAATRAGYFVGVLAGSPPDTDPAEIGRLIDAVQEAAGQAESRYHDYYHKRLAIVLAERGQIELALAQRQFISERADRFSGRGLENWNRFTVRGLVDARLRHGSVSEAEVLAMRLAPSDPSLLETIARSLIDRHNDRTAVEFIEKHGLEEKMLLPLARIRLRVGDAEAAGEILSRGHSTYPELDELWSDITVALADAGKIDAMMKVLPNALKDYGITTRPAVARALFRAGRQEEAWSFLNQAYRGYTQNHDYEDGDRKVTPLAEAFLTMATVPQVVARVRADCAFDLPLAMIEQERDRGHIKNARALLAAIDGLSMTCFKQIVSYPRWEGDLYTMRWHVCVYAMLHPHREAAARLAAVEKLLRTSENLWREWPRVGAYECVATAAVASGEIAAAREFAEKAPEPQIAVAALAAVAAHEIVHAPARAQPLIEAAVAFAPRHPGIINYAMGKLVDSVTCLYADHRDRVPLGGAAACKGSQ
jgi:tetratricopeptide (TPR) repeat protein